MRYEKVDHTADVMIRCQADTLEECFQNAAYAMMDQIVDAETIRGQEPHRIEVQGDDAEERLYAFLSELLFLHDAYQLVLSDFQVTLDGDKVTCTCLGEPLDLERHRPKGEIKAVTYHMLTVTEEPPMLTVIFDL